VDNKHKLPGEADKASSSKANLSKNLPLIALILLGLPVIYLKHAHLAVPGLGWDAGAVFVIGMVFVGFSVAIFYGHRQDATQDLIAQGKYKLAEHDLRKGISWHRKLGPLSADYVNDLILLSRVCRESGQFVEAEQFGCEVLTVLSRIESENARLVDQPTTAREKQLRAIGNEFTKRTVSLQPEALFELAATQFELGKLSDAERSLNDSLKILSRSLDQLKNPSRKLTDDESWLTKDFVLAAMQKEGDYSGKILQILNSSAMAQLLLAKIYQRQGEDKDEEIALLQADRALRQCINFLNGQILAEEKKAEHYFRRALCFLKLGEHSRAIIDLNRTLELKPPKLLEYAAVCNRGECNNRLGKLDAAVQDFTRALQICPRRGLALMNRAEVYDKLGKRELSECDRKQATAYGYSKPRLDLFPETLLLKG